MLHLARWFVAKVAGYTLGILYPSYMSFKSLESGNETTIGYWLTYWIVWSCITVLEIFDVFIEWMPLYYELKLAFVIWLIHPGTKGAAIVFVGLVKPLLQRHEKHIDSGIGMVQEKTSEQLGLLWERAEKAGINLPRFDAVAGAGSAAAGGGRLRQRGAAASAIDPEVGDAKPPIQPEPATLGDSARSD